MGRPEPDSALGTQQALGDCSQTWVWGRTQGHPPHAAPALLKGLFPLQGRGHLLPGIQ